MMLTPWHPIEAFLRLHEHELVYHGNDRAAKRQVEILRPDKSTLHTVELHKDSAGSYCIYSVDLPVIDKRLDLAARESFKPVMNKAYAEAMAQKPQ